MSFLDTEPAAIQRLDLSGPWARFRITDPRQREATVREICRNEVPLSIGRAGGAAIPALLWSVDDQQGRLHFSCGADAAVLDRLQNPADSGTGLWAAGYLQEAKVQFELTGLQLDRSGARPMLRAEAPRHMLHLPRRRAVRVRRGDAHAPMVCFRHPDLDTTVLRLRVLDISMSGCALWQPAGGEPLPPGADVRNAEVDLDDGDLFHAHLRVHHATLMAGARLGLGLRVGCAWQGLDSDSSETLQRWIARGRRRRDLVSLPFE